MKPIANWILQIMNEINYNMLKIIPATNSDFFVIQNMAKYYVYDIISQTKTKHHEWKLDDDGSYSGFEALPLYWKEKDRYPFIIRYDSELVGFVLINKIGSSSDVDWNMGEFFITRKFHKKGIGKYIASKCFDQFPGWWEVMVIPGNEDAYYFWGKVINQYTEGKFVESIKALPFKNNEERIIFKFDSRDE